MPPRPIVRLCLTVLVLLVSLGSLGGEVGGKALRDTDATEFSSGMNRVCNGAAETERLLRSLVARQAKEIQALKVSQREVAGGYVSHGEDSTHEEATSALLSLGESVGSPNATEGVLQRKHFYTEMNKFKDKILKVAPSMKRLFAGNDPCGNWHGITCYVHSDLLTLMNVELGHAKDVSLVASLPDDLFNSTVFVSVVSVSIVDLDMKKIPSSLFHLPNLEELHLQRDVLDGIPPDIKHLTKLKVLDLSGNIISKFPQQLFNAKSLRTIVLDNNNITVLPYDKNMKGKLPSRVVVRNNHIKILPSEWLYKMKGMRSLDLSGNMISDIVGSPPWKKKLEPNQSIIWSLNLSRNKLKGLPGWVSFYLQKLTQLDLSHNPLGKVDFVKSTMKRLRILSLAHCDIYYLANSISLAPNLAQLDLSHNNMRYISSFASDLRKLTHLNISHNRIKYVANIFRKMTRLRVVNLGFNKLKEVPTAMKGWRDIRTISFRNNRITSVPELLATQDFAKLKNIDLRSNNVTEIPVGIKDGPNGHAIVFDSAETSDRLMAIAVRKFLLKVIPAKTVDELFPEVNAICSSSLSAFPSPWKRVSCPTSSNGIRALDLSRLFDGHIPDGLFGVSGMEQFQVLDLSHNKLKSIPADLSHMENLSELRLSHNRFTKIPESVGMLKNLRRLFAKYCRIKQFPSNFTELKSLSQLYMSLNDIEELPDNFHEMSSLRIVSLTQNKLQVLPERIGDLKLAYLNLASNRIRSLPDSFVHLTHLTHEVDLSHNMLEYLPKNFAYLSRSVSAIFLNDNRLRELPSDFGVLPIDNLNLDNNIDLKELPDSMSGMIDMKRLSVQNCGLKRLPDLSHWNKLEHLNIRNNALTSWGNLGAGNRRIIYVNFSRNRLSSVPVSFGDIGSLSEGRLHVDVSGNLISSFPPKLLWTLATTSNTTNVANEGYNEINMAGNPMSEIFRDVDWTQFPFKSMLPELSVVRLPEFALGKTPASVTNIAKKLLGLSDESSLEWFEGRSFHADMDCTEIHALGENREKHQLRIVRCICKAGYYFDMDSMTCAVCLEGAECADNDVVCKDGSYLKKTDSGSPKECVRCTSQGARCVNNEISTYPGYWQPFPESPDVFACRSSEICLGGAVSSSNTSSTCAEGHGGPLCQQCTRGRFADSSTGKCLECPSNFQTLIYMSTMAVSVVVVIALMSSIEGRAGAVAVKSNAGSGLSVSTGGFASTNADMTRLTFSFGQVLCIFPAVYDVKWGAWLETLSEYLAWTTLDFLSPSSLSCLFEHSFFDNSLTSTYSSFSFYESLTMILVVPPIMCLTATFVVAGMILFRRSIKPAAGITEKEMKVFLGRWCFIVLTLSYLPVCTKAIQFLYCRSFDGGETYWIWYDLSTQCYSTNWYAFLPLPALTLTIFGFGLPLSIAVLSMSTPESELVLGVWRMFSVYKRNYRWWDAVELIRKLFITAVTLLVTSIPQFQVMLALMLSFAVLVIQMLCNPFQRASLNAIQTLQLILTFCTLSIALIQSSDIPKDFAGVYAGVVIFLDAMMIAVVLAGVLLSMLRRVKGLKPHLIRKTNARSALPLRIP